MMYYGRGGYVEATRKICETHRYIERGYSIICQFNILENNNCYHDILCRLREINGIRVMGKPDACIVAVESEKFNIYRVSDAMGKKGWSLSPLQFPPRYWIMKN